MNNDEAKFILQAYRPGGGDAQDALFAQALEQARRDPALAAWFERERGHDAAMAAKLRTIVPPAELRSAILAGGRIASRRPRRWVVPAWIGLAASVAVILAAALFWLQPAQAEEFSEFAMDYASGPFRLSNHQEDLDKLRAWLAERQAPLPLRIPSGCEKLQALGCKTVDYRGKSISLICFERGREFHLFVARRTDYPNLRECPKPEFKTKGKWASAHWSDNENCYVLASDAGVDELQRMF